MVLEEFVRNGVLDVDSDTTCGIRERLVKTLRADRLQNIQMDLRHTVRGTFPLDIQYPELQQ